MTINETLTFKYNVNQLHPFKLKTMQTIVLIIGYAVVIYICISWYKQTKK